MKYLIAVCFIIFSCSHTDPKLDEKSADLYSYYKNELKSEIPENGMIIILQNQRCSACRLSTFERLAKLLIKNNSPKTFILGVDDPALIKIIASTPNSSLRIDSLHKLKEYGLDYATDLFFLFKESKLTKWFEISNENLDHVQKLE